MERERDTADIVRRGDELAARFESYEPDPAQERRVYPEPAKEGHPYYCAMHDTLEFPPDGGAFRECGECWHLYATEADLVAATNDLIAQCGFPVPAHENADKIYSCPFCIHDF